MTARRRRRGISTLFVVLGIVAVLGGTFAAGFLAGRHWTRVQVLTGLVKPRAGKEPDRRALAARATEAPPAPPLTFYQELTAPLASPPPRSSSTRPSPPPAPPERAATVAPQPAPSSPAAERTATAQAPGPAARGFTVQVAAYGGRAQAESLAERLGALGFHADVSEIATPSGTRYRVRVGTYPTKEAAREAAARLAAATSLGGFVAAR